MAELEPGHPDGLHTLLANWLRQANEPTGELLPMGIPPTEWAVRQFINAWRKPVRSSIDSLEASLREALRALDSGDLPTARHHVECARQTLGDDLRDDLGIYEWHREHD